MRCHPHLLEMFGQESFAVGHTDLTDEVYRTNVAELITRRAEIAETVVMSLRAVKDME
ncbi:hypothetical protein [Bogoriella caseilytica]|uniref:Uncharacterized protein n=1 Tax=Bogoriella caseilytica TaxID=56055 RepID=A0A3N2B9X9_9MICO|nr:hypothetical protein [Bogoriella caseilytica]ROR72083.1 hypothetical protein EDD31_0429 [Bogoriella caseilytica]